MDFSYFISLILLAACVSVHSFPSEEQIRRIAPGLAATAPVGNVPSGAGPVAALNQETLKTDSSYGYGYAYPYSYYYYPRYYSYGYGYPYYAYYGAYYGWPYYR